MAGLFWWPPPVGFVSWCRNCSESGREPAFVSCGLCAHKQLQELFQCLLCSMWFSRTLGRVECSGSCLLSLCIAGIFSWLSTGCPEETGWPSLPCFLLLVLFLFGTYFYILSGYTMVIQYMHIRRRNQIGVISISSLSNINHCCVWDCHTLLVILKYLVFQYRAEEEPEVIPLLCFGAFYRTSLSPYSFPYLVTSTPFGLSSFHKCMRTCGICSVSGLFHLT